VTENSTTERSRGGKKTRGKDQTDVEGNTSRKARCAGMGRKGTLRDGDRSRFKDRMEKHIPDLDGSSSDTAQATRASQDVP